MSENEQAISNEVMSRSEIGDYKQFYSDIAEYLEKLGISIAGKPLSHLGYKTATLESYNQIRDSLMPLCSEYLENEHNGRPILKAILKTPLQLAAGAEVSMVELMPPKPNKHYSDGLEHLGVVLGKDLSAFVEQHRSDIDEIQDQGPYCKPACIVLANGSRVKFYEYSLREAIELEGQTFLET